MARYTGPVCRLCRRERMKLYLKGAKCDTMKCPIERRPYPPGDHGRSRRTNTSEYLVQLREKQKARRIYGLMEKQFRKLYAEANRQQGVTGENLLRLLECRLGHVKVNGKRVTIPSYEVRKGNAVSLGDKARSMIVIRHNVDTLDRRTPPWIEMGDGGNEATVRDLPMREHIDVPVREQLIVELYSK